MKKRNMLALILVVILAFVLGLGTMAYYRKTFSSGENLVRAAKFEVDSNGTLDEDVEFNLSEEPIYPGYNNENVYEFEIDKKGTEVAVKYNITVTANGELFEAVEEGNSPVVMTLYRGTENGWVSVANELEINPVEKGVENFKIGLKWNHSDYDIEYQNKSGNIAINVVATQVGGVTPPEEPTIVSLVDPAPITVTVGDPVTMPSTVVANMSDGTTKDVPVTWNPAAIDTTTAGTKTAAGTVEGFNGNVTFTVTVEEAAEPTLELEVIPVGNNYTEYKIRPIVSNIEGADKFVIKYTIIGKKKQTPMTKLDAPEEDLPIISFLAENGEVGIYNISGLLLHTFYNVKLIY